MSFDRVSGEYADRAVVQRRAASKILGLLGLSGGESVLDVGCGPGHITAMLADATTGRVVGTDDSGAMVEEARSNRPDIEFRRVAAEDLDFKEEFDAVLCNSVLHWFRDPERVLGLIHGALKNGGRIALACPATGHFSPFFERVIIGVARRPEITPVFSHWKNPWFFLPDVDAYREMFERCSFRTIHLSIDHEVHEHSADEAYGVYSSAAVVGYASPEYYDCDITGEYVEKFNRAVRKEIEGLAVGGRVSVDFNRLYYVGAK